MPFAAQFQKMIQMAAQIVKRRAGLLRQERYIEIQSRRAAEIEDRMAQNQPKFDQ